MPPTIAAVRALVARGHNVRFLGDDSILPEMRATGARTLPWRRAPNRRDRSPQSCFARDWETADTIAAFRSWANAIFLGPAALYAEDVVEAARAELTDLLVGCDLLFGGMVAAEALRIPSALLATNVSLLRLPGHPPFGPGLLPPKDETERQKHEHLAQMGQALFDSFLPPLNAARARFGLAPLDHVFDQVRPERLLLATSPSFDLPTTALPSFVRYVGPILEEPAWIERGRLPTRGAGWRPTVLVSFSTTYQGQEAALAATMDALSDLPVRGIVTMGNALDGKAFVAPANVEIVRGASHDAILPQAAAVITHAGHGTTLRALRAGVPILALPMGRDQNENAARVEYHGVGLRLDPRASAEKISAALRRILSEPEFTANARRLSRALAEEGDGAQRFAAEVEALAALRLKCAGDSEANCRVA